MTSNVYEDKVSLDMYLGMHFPAKVNGTCFPGMMAHNIAPLHTLFFAQRVAQILIGLNPPLFENVLDIGCAVGGSAFELATKFDQVDAFDYSSSFVHAAQQIQRGEEMEYGIPIEGDIREIAIVSLEESQNNVREKVNFFVGDATQMDHMTQLSTKQYDAILMANLICRLPDPDVCLLSVSKLIKPGGVILLTTPFSWLEEFTGRDNWMGGKDGIRGLDVLERRMKELDFDKIFDEEVPLTIREHARKYQYIISKATGWRKRSARVES
jgi:putative 4-mercaptohistidine N1-methyltranferase